MPCRDGSRGDDVKSRSSEVSELELDLLLVACSLSFGLGAALKRLPDRSLRSIFSSTWPQTWYSHVCVLLPNVYEKSMFVRLSTENLLHSCDSVESVGALIQSLTRLQECTYDPSHICLPRPLFSHVNCQIPCYRNVQCFGETKHHPLRSFLSVNFLGRISSMYNTVHSYSP